MSDRTISPQGRPEEVVVDAALRPAEPTPENLKALCAAVREHGADVGFAQDMDADRLADPPTAHAHGPACQHPLHAAARVPGAVLVRGLQPGLGRPEQGQRHPGRRRRPARRTPCL